MVIEPLFGFSTLILLQFYGSHVGQSETLFQSNVNVLSET